MNANELRAALRQTAANLSAQLAGRCTEPVTIPLPAGWVWVSTPAGRRAVRS